MSDSEATIITIKAEPIELCQLMKFGDEVETQKRKKVRAGDRVTFNGQTIQVAL